MAKKVLNKLLAKIKKAKYFFNIVKDILTRFDLDVHNLRGQCYNRAANVSGRITGLQARIKKCEPQALYVHCNAQSKFSGTRQDGVYIQRKKLLVW